WLPTPWTSTAPVSVSIAPTHWPPSTPTRPTPTASSTPSTAPSSRAAWSWSPSTASAPDRDPRRPLPPPGVAEHRHLPGDLAVVVQMARLADVHLSIAVEVRADETLEKVIRLGKDPRRLQRAVPVAVQYHEAPDGIGRHVELPVAVIVGDRDAGVPE